MLLLAFLLQAAQATQPMPPPHMKPVFTYDDYPAEAVRNRWQGTVVVDLTISRDGSPTACRIVQSSGHKVLDDATCDLIMRRAKFVPARDMNGNPIESHLQAPPVTWAIQ